MGNQVKEPMKFVFIGGTGRCGTNLLKDIMAKHPDVAMLPFEYRFIIDPEGIIDYYNSMTAAWSPFVADVKIKRLRHFLLTVAKKNRLHHPLNVLLKRLNRSGKKISLKWYHEWELDKWLPNFESHVNALMEQLIAFDYNGCWPGTESYSIDNRVDFSPSPDRKQLAGQLGGFITACIRDFLIKEKKNCFVEDNTWNILFAKELFELLPEVRLIHLYRDPRDVVASFMGQRWCPPDLESSISYYRSIIERWFTIKPSLPRERFLEIRFEELVSDRENVLNRVCEFSGLSMEDNLCTGDFSKSNTGRWRKDLSESQQEVLRKGLADIPERLNY